MKTNPTPRQPEHSTTKLRADWFDEVHDSVLILEGRDHEENGSSPLSDVFYQCA